ncbi:histone deacetylase family protein [Natronospira bacteriovora]|uniref:Histone deacetylase n=1 Tax=Natronospira bacteriovora TaxID=3069753 RepID=A0ABU0W6U0_9GAMM|nr:histone deacetylase [Natronospira sp. AB-CW4]MDQ2069742.1 histone deacetylase [Natronospira sp. AB-CW4]
MSDAGNQRRVLLINDPRVLDHRPDVEDEFLPGRLNKRVRGILSSLVVKWNYPEHPGRITAITDLLASEPIEGLRMEEARPASREELSRVHTATYLESIYKLRDKHAWLDVDTTAVSPGSVQAAEVAAGSAVRAVEAVMKGEADSAFALCRPPGHHANAVRARGFCIFNNVAVAAAHAQMELGCERVLIVDWDAHHGNGTQDIFWANPDVMLFDTHRSSPFYPGSGAMEEVGEGIGEGTTINVPLPEGSGDAALIKAFEEILTPAAEWFQPDLILVSAGFDPHRLDLCLNATHEGFSVLTSILQQMADRLCDGRLAFVLEGGYNLVPLARGVHTVLGVLSGNAPRQPIDPGLSAVDEAREFHLSAFADEEDDRA